MIVWLKWRKVSVSNKLLRLYYQSAYLSCWKLSFQTLRDIVNYHRHLQQYTQTLPKQRRLRRLTKFINFQPATCMALVTSATHNSHVFQRLTKVFVMTKGLKRAVLHGEDALSFRLYRHASWMLIQLPRIRWYAWKRLDYLKLSLSRSYVIALENQICIQCYFNVILHFTFCTCIFFINNFVKIIISDRK